MGPTRAARPGGDADRVCIVVTTGSGEGRARGLARRLASLLRGRGRTVTIETFAELGALRHWARACRPGFSLLVCIGGDATQSAAALAARRHQIPFAPVPLGFGNLFARVFDHPSAPRRVARLIETGQVHMVDVGVIGGGDGELFLSHRSYGPLDRIQAQVETGGRQPRDRRRRHAAYYAMAAQAFWRLPLVPRRVEVDGTVVSDAAVVVTVANVETYRGFLSLTPSASPVDGRFDVLVIPHTSRLGLVWRLLRLKLGLPGRWNDMLLSRGREVVVTTGTHRDTLRVAHRALPLLLPPGALAAFTGHSVAADAPAPAVA